MRFSARELALVWNTGIHVKPSQIFFRIRKKILDRFRRTGIHPSSDSCSGCSLDFMYLSEDIPDNLTSAEVSSIVRQGEAFLKNEFTFLNELPIVFSDKVSWDANPYNYRLWCFNLNYFDFLITLRRAYLLTRDDSFLHKGLELISSWLDYKPYKNTVMWDPFVVAKRLINWLTFVQFTTRHIEINLPPDLMRSFHKHAKFLESNVEHHLKANHVIMEAKGLVFAGICLGQGNLVTKGLKLLKQEYNEQIMPDGGHYERSPSYHVEVMAHYMECARLLNLNGWREEGHVIQNMIRPMFDYLRYITMPNQEIPLLNDSSLEYPFCAQEVLQCGVVLFNSGKYKLGDGNRLSWFGCELYGVQGKKLYATVSSDKISVNLPAIHHTGYHVIRDVVGGRSVFFLFDCGNGGPDYNLGHAHADALSVLLTIDDQKLLIDSGTYTYMKSHSRNYYRSTKAHNTITIDSQSSSQVWSAFRVAKRSKTTVLHVEENTDWALISAQHDGYMRILRKTKLIHRRTVFHIKGYGLVIFDILFGTYPKRHEAELRFILGAQSTVEDRAVYFPNTNTHLICSLPIVEERVPTSEYFGCERLSNSIVSHKMVEDTQVIYTTILFANHTKPIGVKLEGTTAEVFYAKSHVLLDLQNNSIRVEDIEH